MATGVIGSSFRGFNSYIDSIHHLGILEVIGESTCSLGVSSQRLSFETSSPLTNR